MRYLCEIREALARRLVVEADSLDDAREKLQQAYDNEEIVLDFDDYEDAEIEVLDQDVPEDFEIDTKNLANESMKV